jgi:hypothetical protein
MQMPDIYSDRIFKLKPKLDKCITVLGDYPKNNENLVG